MSGELILVVDDNPVNLKLACALLTRNGYEVYIETRTFIKTMMRFLEAPREENDAIIATLQAG